MATLQRLLAQRPEQEKRLLELLVDKLGDPDSTVAAKTLHLLNQLRKFEAERFLHRSIGKPVVEQHPGMKHVVVNEVERLLFRQNIRPSAQSVTPFFRPVHSESIR